MVRRNTKSERKESITRIYGGALSAYYSFQGALSTAVPEEQRMRSERETAQNYKKCNWGANKRKIAHPGNSEKKRKGN